MTREVFITHVEREQEALRGFLLALCCGNRDDADDLAQDTLVKAYISSTGYQDKGKFRSWLFKIAHNTFLNHKASLRMTESIDEARKLISSTSTDAAFQHQDLYLALAYSSTQGTVSYHALLPQRVQYQRNCHDYRDQRRGCQEAAFTWSRQTERETKAMMKDKALEELFLAQTPHFDDKAQFMARLTQRLDAVEYIRQYQEATLRRYRMAMVAAFVVGVISGIAAIMFILSAPADVPLFTFHVQAGFLLWLAENSRVIVATALSLLTTVGFVSIMGNVQEIISMRQRIKTM